jgi:uncharacterized cupin superfamily protein
MNAIEQVRRANIGADGWEPCVTSDGRPLGTAKWLRRRGGDAWSHTAMLWRCEPMTFDYDFPGDESFVVIEGRVRIALKDGSGVIEFGAGDVGSFPKGAKSVWTVVQTIVKFTVVSA